MTFANQVFFAGFFQVGPDDLPGVFLGLRFAQSHLFGEPVTEQLVAPGTGLELQLRL